MTSKPQTSTAGRSCRGLNTSGAKCRAHAASNGWCALHDPAMAARRAAGRRLGGERHFTPHAADASRLPAEGIRSVADVLALLDYTLAEVLAIDNGIARGRILVAIGGAYLEALSVGEFETRLMALEQIIAQRGGGIRDAQRKAIAAA